VLPEPRHASLGVGTAPDGLRTAHVDFLLRFLIARSTISQGGALERLDALERAMVTLTRHWRTDAPLAPARELRASEETIDALLAWVEQGGALDTGAMARLGVYASGAVTDRAVPEGWVRVHLSHGNP
jgi:hypothetical protein